MSTDEIPAAQGERSERKPAPAPVDRSGSIGSPSSRAGRKTAAVSMLAVALAGGCTDLPTGVEPLEWLGAETAGLLPPASLPNLASWGASIAAEGGGTEIRERVRLMETRSLDLLGRGRFQEAANIRLEAAGVLAGAIRAAPDAALLEAGSGGIEEWIARLSTRIPEGVSPRLDTEVATIQAAPSRAAAALGAGDTISAAVELLRAGERIRSVVPLAIASRAVWQAEERIAPLPSRSTNRLRADHLLSSAREALEENELLLAGRRAVYARQIAEGFGIGIEAPNAVEE